LTETYDPIIVTTSTIHDFITTLPAVKGILELESLYFMLVLNRNPFFEEEERRPRS
jgi:hypothetical protein